jgi:type II secretory pathway pseudopilin PulG
MTSSGFSLVEMLIATALLTTVVAVTFGLLNPTQGTFQAQAETEDLQQRLRVAADVLAASLRAAGAGPLVGIHRGPLVHSLPPVLPYRIGERDNDAAAGVHYRSDAISLLSVPATGAQAALLDAALPGATVVTMSWPPSCPPASAASVCGFAVGTRVLLFDATGAWDAATVAGVSGTTLQFARPLLFGYLSGAAVSEVVIRSLAFRIDASGVPQLAQYDGFQAEFPVVDNVVSVAFRYFGESQPPRLLASTALDPVIGPWTTYGPRPPAVDVDRDQDSWPPGENCVFQTIDGEHVPRLSPLGVGGPLIELDESLLTDGPWCPDAGTSGAFDADLLRIRRVRVQLRLQVGSASLRGPSGDRFLRGGRSTSAERSVPDQQIEFDVAPFNLAVGR